MIKKALFLFLMSADMAFAALPATDAFTAVDGTALETYSANWTIVQGSFKIYGNSANPQAGGVHGYAAWNADLPNASQYVQAKVYPIAGTAIGVALRGSLVAMTNYMCRTDGVNVGIEGWNGGSYLGAIGTGSVMTVNAGDLLRFEAVGSALTCKINGVVVSSGTDSTLTSGYAGLSSFNNGFALDDDFEVGNLTSPTRQKTVFFR